ncbi:MAG: AlpA family phage regulatory protein [Acidobacteria bacterium]|nr:AlpA family phage regulatory protein [Acidobacteriota bacterium]
MTIARIFHQPPSTLPPDDGRILSLPDVMRLTGLSRSSISRLVRARHFPASIRLPAGAIGFRAAAVSSWLASRPASR